MCEDEDRSRSRMRMRVASLGLPAKPPAFQVSLIGSRSRFSFMSTGQPLAFL